MNESEEEHTQRAETVRKQVSQLCSNKTAEQDETRAAPNRIKTAQTQTRLSYVAQKKISVKKIIISMFFKGPMFHAPVLENQMICLYVLHQTE